MPITFVNIWETKILDTIRTFLNAEFAGSIPVYTGSFKDMGSQSIRLNPVGSDLIDRMTTAELREYIVDVSYTFKEKTVKKGYLGAYTQTSVTHRNIIFSKPQ